MKSTRSIKELKFFEYTGQMNKRRPKTPEGKICALRETLIFHQAVEKSPNGPAKGECLKGAVDGRLDLGRVTSIAQPKHMQRTKQCCPCIVTQDWLVIHPRPRPEAGKEENVHWQFYLGDRKVNVGASFVNTMMWVYGSPWHTFSVPGTTD